MVYWKKVTAAQWGGSGLQLYQVDEHLAGLFELLLGRRLIKAAFFVLFICPSLDHQGATDMG
jgi:hypothetical protein